MATKNIVPRANQEGGIGTDAKKWDKQIAVTGSFTTISGSLTGKDLILVSGSSVSSASFGRIDTAGRILENGTSVTDHGTAMAIVFGG
jgi:hypothetical protein